MNKFFVTFFAAFLMLGGVVSAQTKDYTITNSGWGRLETGFRQGIAPYEIRVSELDIHRWRKTTGELILNEGEKLLTVRLPRKELVYVLLTESHVHKDRNGWSYVEHRALENDHTYCRVWNCTHEDGSRQILVLYSTFVQGYKIIPAEK